MRLHRVTWVDPDWSSPSRDERLHPLFVDVARQGRGRFDNPAHYSALYASSTPPGAVGETLGNLHTWFPHEITRTNEGRPRCLVTFEIPEPTGLLDLDNSQMLVQLGLPPSDVVRRDPDHTQPIALALWASRTEGGKVGIQWWSYWRPEWTLAMLWSDEPGAETAVDAKVVSVEPLTPDHEAVLAAAEELPRHLA